MRYLKYHALGNDYIVLRPESFEVNLSPEVVRIICHRNYGIGSDGILYGPVESSSCNFGLRIFNPDGSEAEKSGNGLRIFARSLYEEGLVGEQPFTWETLGGAVSCKVEDGGAIVTVQMGEVSFDSRRIPVAGPPREVLNEDICINGKVFKFCAATVGNPHCVVLTDAPSSDDARRYGPLIENDPRFPNRTNVQFMKVIDRGNIQIEIWERGARLHSGIRKQQYRCCGRRSQTWDVQPGYHRAYARRRFKHPVLRWFLRNNDRTGYEGVRRGNDGRDVWKNLPTIASIIYPTAAVDTCR